MENNGRFSKGHTPHNLGVKGTHFSSATEFKKGSSPSNGAITKRRSYDKEYMFIRIDARKWIHLQVFNWKATGREIPPGHLLACKTQDTLNCEPDNWELITRAELLARNRKIAVKAKRPSLDESRQIRHERFKAMMAKKKIKKEAQVIPIPEKVVKPKEVLPDKMKAPKPKAPRQIKPKAQVSMPITPTTPVLNIKRKLMDERNERKVNNIIDSIKTKGHQQMQDICREAFGDGLIMVKIANGVKFVRPDQIQNHGN